MLLGTYWELEKHIGNSFGNMVRMLKIIELVSNWPRYEGISPKFMCGTS
jgi:hypothetical protein